MTGNLSVEELVIDDSFNEYCLQSDESAILFWEEYIRANPSQKDKIEEAKQLVLGLRAMLVLEEQAGTEEETREMAKVIALPRPKSEKRRKRFFVAAAAAVLALLIGAKFYFSGTPIKSPSVIAESKGPDEANSFTTKKGEKKKIVLPDNTTLYLNSGSSLSIDKDFGKTNRTVYLSGEALFDVTHKESLPFIVRMDNYDVKVLGTLFNVKAYPGDKQSETALIRGKVEIQMPGSSEKIILSPNQKVIVKKTNKDQLLKDGKTKLLQEGDIALLPLSYNKDSLLIETAWVQNRLEIVDESFEEIKEKLERWYGVKINFDDTEVTNYTFSATFEKETIEQVLNALQYAYHFNYVIKENEITISK